MILNDQPAPGDWIRVWYKKRSRRPIDGRWARFYRDCIELTGPSGKTLMIKQDGVREVEITKRDPYVEAKPEFDWKTPTTFAEMIERLEEKDAWTGTQ